MVGMTSAWYGLARMGPFGQEGRKFCEGGAACRILAAGTACKFRRREDVLTLYTAASQLRPSIRARRKGEPKQAMQAR